MKSIKAITLSLIMALLLGVTSCSESTGSNSLTGTTVMVFATLTSVNSTSCAFTFQQQDDSPEVTVTCSAQLNSNYKVGNRYIIIFLTDNDDPFTSGPVTLQSIVDIYNGDVATASKADITKMLANVSIISATPSRSGEYINVVSEASRYYSDSNVTYNIYVDETTVDDAYPEAYVVLTTSDTGTYGTTNYYGSFNISSVWNRTTCRGLNVHYTNSSNAASEVKFEKTGIDLIEPSSPTE